MVKNILNRYKAIVLSFIAFVGLLTLSSLQTTSYAADYSVGANGWSDTNHMYNTSNWNNYWGNNPNGNVNWNDWQYTHSSTGTTDTSTSMTYPNVIHGLPPQVRSGEDMRNLQTGQTTGVRVYAQNVSPEAFTTTICAQDMVNGQSYHLGCVPQAPFANAANEVGRFDFNLWQAPVAGEHNVSLTYRDRNGNWVPIKTPWYQPHTVNFST